MEIVSDLGDYSLNGDFMHLINDCLLVRLIDYKCKNQEKVNIQDKLDGIYGCFK